MARYRRGRFRALTSELPALFAGEWLVNRAPTKSSCDKFPLTETQKKQPEAVRLQPQTRWLKGVCLAMEARRRCLACPLHRRGKRGGSLKLTSQFEDRSANT